MMVRYRFDSCLKLLLLASVIFLNLSHLEVRNREQEALAIRGFSGKPKPLHTHMQRRVWNQATTMSTDYRISDYFCITSCSLN